MMKGPSTEVGGVSSGRFGWVMAVSGDRGVDSGVDSGDDGEACGRYFGLSDA